MTEIEGLIHFWEEKLKDRLLDVTTRALIESTVRNLKKLQEIEKKEGKLDVVP